jgi:Leucine-rich repeat (LRR) protein
LAQVFDAKTLLLNWCRSHSNAVDLQIKCYNHTIIGMLFLTALTALSSCGGFYNSVSGIKQARNGKLNLSHSNLTEIPKYVFEMEELTTLILHNNEITEIPPEIGKLVNLQKLVISRNKLTSLPPEIGQLINLKKLSVKANQIESLPPEIGSLKNLEELWLNFNRLKELPPEIGNLSNLSHLYVDYNLLTSLPPEIGKLLNLQHFVIGRNNLQALPAEFYTLTGMIVLDLSYSGPMLKLGEDICNFRRLETLIIDQGTLSFAPRCLEVRANSLDRFSIIIR